MKLDKKFEERIKLILDKYAIRDDYVQEELPPVPDNSEEDNKSDGYETVDTAQFLEIQKAAEEKDLDELIRKKYYFYYKILSKNEISDEMEDVYDDEIEELNTLQITKGVDKDGEQYFTLFNGKQEQEKSDKKKSANNKKIAVIYFYDEKLAE